MKELLLYGPLGLKALFLTVIRLTWRRFYKNRDLCYFLDGTGIDLAIHPNRLLPPPLDVLRVARDIPHHHPFHYGNQRALSKAYFSAAKTHLNEPYLYVVFSNTGSPAGNLISYMTKKKYSHMSLSFDRELTTLVSYNGGNGISAPGLNQEWTWQLRQKEGASILIFGMVATSKQKRVILKELRRINEEGSSYNVTGILAREGILENILFCSQFVYLMLTKAGLSYFVKNPVQVKPLDFLIKNQKRQLQFLEEIKL